MERVEGRKRSRPLSLASGAKSFKESDNNRQLMLDRSAFCAGSSQSARSFPRDGISFKLANFIVTKLNMVVFSVK